MRDNGNGLFVPVPVDKPVYPKECYREFEGTITLEAEFHIARIVRNRDQAQIEKVMPMARSIALKKLAETGDPQLEMAVTLLERMGLIDEMLKAVAPVFRDAK